MTRTVNTIVKIVIGSWGSYNADNEKSLGSKWLILNIFNSWEEIEKELAKEGFNLKGIDEELFIQDVESEFNPKELVKFSPKSLFETFKNSGIFEDGHAFKEALAFCDCCSFSDFFKLVEEKGKFWFENLYYFDGDLYDYGREKVHDSMNIPSWMEDYIDYEKIAKDDEMSDFIRESEFGIIAY